MYLRLTNGEARVYAACRRKVGEKGWLVCCEAKDSNSLKRQHPEFELSYQIFPRNALLVDTTKETRKLYLLSHIKERRIDAQTKDSFSQK